MANNEEKYFELSKRIYGLITYQKLTEGEFTIDDLQLSIFNLFEEYCSQVVK